MHITQQSKILLTFCVLLCACPYTDDEGVCPGGFCILPKEADAGAGDEFVKPDDDSSSSIPIDNGVDSGVEDVDAGADQDSEDEGSEDESSHDEPSPDDSSSDSCCKHPGHKGPHQGKHKCKHGNGRSWQHRCWR